jgi:hypothetical protein
MNARAKELLGTSYDRWWLLTGRPGVVWCNCPTIGSANGLDPDVLTRVEVEARETITRSIEFLRASMPGFGEAYLLETAPQMGVRQTRLLKGEVVVTHSDWDEGRDFADSIGRSRRLHLPYRALVPHRVDGLLVAGRCYSATPRAQAVTREIAPCMVMGQAAGTAAALAVGAGVSPRDVDVGRLQDALRTRGVIL